MKKQEKEEYVKQVFNSIAPVYDLMNMVMTFGLVRRWYLFVSKHSKLQRGERVLDVGTGTGELAFLLSREVGASGEVIGVDISTAMLDVARKKRKKRAAPLVFFMVGDALDLPFSSGSFDCVTTAFTLRNVTDISQAVLELVRVCKKEGRVVCLEISEPVQPLFKTGFQFYYYRLIPILGRLADKGCRMGVYPPPYTWLAQSLHDFPQGEDMTDIFCEAGLRNVTCHTLSGGVVSVYEGIKK